MLRGDEFCSDIHRKHYTDRLGKALTNIGAPEPPPAPTADFLSEYPVQSGNTLYITALWDFNHRAQALRYRRQMPLTIARLDGHAPMPMAWPAPADALRQTTVLSASFAKGEIHLPPAITDIAADEAAAKEDEVRVKPVAGACPLEAVAAETMVFAVETAAPLARSIAAMAPSFATQRQVPTLSRAKQTRPLHVYTAPVAAKFVSPAASIAGASPAVVRLPKFEVTPVEVSVEPVALPAACKQWMASPAAEPVEVEVLMASAAEQCGVPAMTLPSLRCFAMAEPSLPLINRLEPSLDAEPVAMNVWPRTAAAASPLYSEIPAPRIPDTRHMKLVDAPVQATPLAPHVAAPAAELVERMVLPACVIQPVPAQAAQPMMMQALPPRDLKPGTELAGQVAGPQAEPVESIFTCSASQAVLIFAGAEMRLPSLPEAPPEASMVAALTSPAAFGIRPAAQQRVPTPMTVESIHTLFVVPPKQEEPAEAAAVGMAARDFIPLEFYCQRTAGHPQTRMVWCAPQSRPILPGLVLNPIFERLEDALPPKKTRKPASMAAILEMQDVKKKPGKQMAMHAIKAVAACLLLGSVIWFGVGTIRIGNQTPAVNRDASATDMAYSSSTGTGSVASGAATASGKVAAAAPSGPVAKLRAAVADRAASTVTDSFHNGMEAWGTQAKQWAQGWSRNPDGYVQTGALALFHPSVNYKDYHMEFFGQIESKSIGWVVRAHDTQNYYGMKLTVIEPGLRPVIAMVHYPVVGGKRGRPVQIPLNVMVHNNAPMQVAVDVRGNKLLTSIDGQLVDTWIDDTLVAGGVGFFSEANERARLYWMRISRNEDFLGRICAYVSEKLGDGSAATAQVWPAEGPQGPQPMPAPLGTQEAGLGATALALCKGLRKDRGRHQWNS